MSGVLEQPAVRGRSTYGAVVLAQAPAGAAPGPDDAARAGEDAPVPIRPGRGVLRPRHEPEAAEPVRVCVEDEVHELTAGRARHVPVAVPDA